MKQLHNIQLGILQRLLFSEGLRYTEMKPGKFIENNRFQFHLDQLVKEYRFVKKLKGKYKLTSIGKEYANRIDDDKVKVERQAKISVWIACTRKRKGQMELLIYTRLKQPFYGCQGFLSGKVHYGESIIDAAKRELKEETNLTTNSTNLVAIVHFRVFDKKNKKLLEDKFMYLCLVKNPKGKVKSNKEGKHKWVKKEKLSNHLTNPFEDKKDFLKFVSYLESYNGKPEFIEVKHFTNKF